MSKARLISGGLWAVSAKGVGVLSGLLVNGLLARLLAPDDVGAYFLSVSFASFLSVIAQSGMPTALVKFIASAMARGDSGRVRSIISRALTTIAGASLLIALLTLCGVGSSVSVNLFHSESMARVVPWIVLLFVSTTFQAAVAEIFRGFHDIRLASWFSGVMASIFSALVFISIWTVNGAATLSTALKISAGAGLFSLGIAGILLMRKIKPLTARGKMPWGDLLDTGWPLAVSSLTVLVAVQGDLWVVGAMLGERQAAIYGVALRLLALMTLFHGLAVSVTQSSVAELYAQGQTDKLEALVQGASFVACAIAGGIFLVLAIFGKPLIEMVFGAVYREAYACLMILAGGQFIGMLFGLTEMVLMMTNHQRVLMWVIVFNTSLGLGLATLLVRWFGIEGVAIAWASMAIMQGGVSWAYVRSRLAISCRARWFPSIVRALRA